MQRDTHTHKADCLVHISDSDSFLNLAVEIPIFLFCFSHGIFHIRKSHVQIQHESGLVWPRLCTPFIFAFRHVPQRNDRMLPRFCYEF